MFRERSVEAEAEYKKEAMILEQLHRSYYKAPPCDLQIFIPCKPSIFIEEEICKSARTRRTLIQTPQPRAAILEGRSAGRDMRPATRSCLRISSSGFAAGTKHYTRRRFCDRTHQL